MDNTKTNDLQKNLLEDIQQKTHTSFLMLLQYASELANNENKEIQSFDALRVDIIHNVMHLDSLMSEDSTSREARIAALQQQQNTVIEGLKRFGQLNIYNYFVDTWLNQLAVRSYVKDRQHEALDGKTLLKVHLSKILRDEEANSKADEDSIFDYITTFMQYIPLRMTTAKYYDYIKDAFACYKKPLSHQELISRKRFFAPMNDIYYCDDTMKIKRKLDQFWQADTQDLETITKMAEQCKEISRQSVEAINALNTLFDSCSALMILLRNKITLEVLLKDYPESKSMLETYKSQSQTGEWPVLPEESEEQLHALIDKAMEALVYGSFDEQPNGEALESEDIQPLFETWKEIDRLYYSYGLAYISHFRFNTESDEADTDSEANLNELIKFMDDYVNGLDGKRKRFMRQRFWGSLPYPYDSETYTNNFIDIYETLDPLNQAVLTFFTENANDDGRCDNFWDFIQGS